MVSRFKTTGLVVVLSVVLAGCSGPLPLFYKEGEEVKKINATLTECRVDSLAKVPVVEQTRYVPPVFANRRYQTSDGRVAVRRVLVTPGGFETFDSNKELREDVTNECMFDKGFRFERIPACTGAVTRATIIRATQVLPPLTAESCAIRIRDGKFQIVSP